MEVYIFIYIGLNFWHGNCFSIDVTNGVMNGVVTPKVLFHLLITEFPENLKADPDNIPGHTKFIYPFLTRIMKVFQLK